MKRLFAELDVSDETTSICIVDAEGMTVAETAVFTTAAAIVKALKEHRKNLQRVGLESGTHAARLYRSLSKAGMPVVCLDARHAHSALKARLNKTDANDAKGLALLLAKGIFTTSFVKGHAAQRTRMLLVFRRSMIRKAKDMEICLTMNLKQVDADERTKLRSGRLGGQASEVDSALHDATQAMLHVIATLKAEIGEQQKAVEQLAKHDPVCRRLMTIPGVGPVTALTFRSAVDDPARFSSSRVLAAYFGLTPRVRQSGSTSYSGTITRAGDAEVRGALYSAAHSLLTTSRSKCALRRWGLILAKRKGRKVAYTAVARKLAVLMHHLWTTGQEFDPER